MVFYSGMREPSSQGQTARRVSPLGKFAWRLWACSVLHIIAPGALYMIWTSGSIHCVQPSLFQASHSMQCLIRQDNVVFMSHMCLCTVDDPQRVVRVAQPRYGLRELDVLAAVAGSLAGCNRYYPLQEYPCVARMPNKRNTTSWATWGVPVIEQ